MKLPKSWTTVTPFSKALALSMLIVLPILGFLFGIRYQSMQMGALQCAPGGVCVSQSELAFPLHFFVERAAFHFFWLLPFIFVGTFLKGYALWIAGKNKQSGWFVALFILNTLGILPIVYIFLSRNKKHPKK